MPAVLAEHCSAHLLQTQAIGMEARASRLADAPAACARAAPHADAAPAVAARRAQPSRRAVSLGSLSALIGAHSARTRPAQAADGAYRMLGPGTVGRFVEQPDGSGWQLFETLQFQLEVPPGFSFNELPTPKANAAANRGGGASVSSVKAAFVDLEGRTITVYEYSASAVKPTLFQLSDISQYGSVSEVARLVTPPQARVVSMDRQVVQQPGRETGTLLGKVSGSQQTLYRYEYELPSGQRVATAAAARAGKVLLAGGISASDQWADQADALRRSINSFRLAFPT